MNAYYCIVRSLATGMKVIAVGEVMRLDSSVDGRCDVLSNGDHWLLKRVIVSVFARRVTHSTSGAPDYGTRKRAGRQSKRAVLRAKNDTEDFMRDGQQLTLCFDRS